MGILMAKKYDTLNVEPRIKALAKEALATLEKLNEKYPNDMGKPSMNDLIDLALHNFIAEMEEIQEGTDGKEVWW
jgi:hypothetical protein